MTLTDSIKTCLIKKPFNFTGRASRSEYWWFYLFLMILSFLLQRLGTIGSVLNFCLWIPQISAATRRLHDSDLSGWFQILPLGIMGFSILLLIDGANMSSGVCFLAAVVVAFYLYCRPGTPGSNRFGNVSESSQDVTGANVPQSLSPNRPSQKSGIDLTKKSDN